MPRIRCGACGKKTALRDSRARQPHAAAFARFRHAADCKKKKSNIACISRRKVFMIRISARSEAKNSLRKFERPEEMVPMKIDVARPCKYRAEK